MAALLAMALVGCGGSSGDGTNYWMVSYTNGWHQYIETVVSNGQASGEVNYNTVGGTGPEHWTSLMKNSDGSYETSLWSGATISFDGDTLHIQSGSHSFDAKKISGAMFKAHENEEDGQ